MLHSSWRRVLVRATAPPAGSCSVNLCAAFSRTRPLTSYQPSTNYLSAFDESMRNKDKFWSGAAQDIDWIEPFSQVYDGSGSPFEKWFSGGTLNTCYNCVDRHVKAEVEAGAEDASRAAIIYDSPVTGVQEVISYRALLDKVQRLSGVLVAQGVQKGDVVAIYMPMVPEAQVAMLACARIGAVHCVVFGGFAAPELAVRLRDARPKVVLTASCGLEGLDRVVQYKPLLDRAVELAAAPPAVEGEQAGHQVSRVLVLQRPQAVAEMLPGRDLDWKQEVDAAEPFTACVPVHASDPSYILYTSGTTGLPKGVVRDTGGHAVVLHWSMKNILGMQPGSVWWSASDIGWVVGHSFTTFAPLLLGCATVLYEGKPVGTPDSAQYWRLIERWKINGVFTAPTAVRAIKQHDTDGKLAQDFDLSSLKAIFLAGERCDPNTLQWLENTTGRPALDNWWQTETGWPICANLVGVEGFVPVKYGSVFRPVPGYDLRVLDEESHEPMPRGSLGQLVLKLPLPPGTLKTLLHNDQRFLDAYMSKYPGFYDTGDAGIIDEDGYVHIMSRTDDVINVAAHRLSSGEMEEILMDHPEVAEAVVIGCRDELRGQVPLGMVVLNQDCVLPMTAVQAELVQMVRDRIGPVAYFRQCVQVQRFPKTRSGKILRGTLRKIADGQPYVIPPTVDDPSIFDEIAQIVSEHSS